MKLAKTALLLALAGIFLLSGCFREKVVVDNTPPPQPSAAAGTLKTTEGVTQPQKPAQQVAPAPASASTASKQTTTAKPTPKPVPQSASVFAGDWKLTRQTISPEPPVPGLVIGMVLKSSPKWQITNSKSTGRIESISFDGKDNWFSLPSFGVQGLKIATTTREITETGDSKLTASRNMTISADKISILGLPKLTNAKADIQEEIVMVMDKADSVKVTITLNVTGGTYTKDGEIRHVKPFTAFITYTGIKVKK